MQEASDEDLFLAFQKQRDVASLSRLFSRHADELLRLAVFLSPRPTDAEDLLQATFLSAIARAETYREGFRVKSWLCGILTNHARMLRRAERRRSAQAASAGDGTGDAWSGDEGHGPVDEALRSELRAALERSIRQLGEPYRSVLTLHLNDGLNSQEISQRLHRPAATVRKQMGRALQQLRQVLPLGLATALVVKMSPAQVASNAAEAAQFVEVPSGPDALLDPVEAPDFDEGIWLDPVASPLRVWAVFAGLAAAAALVALVLPLWSPVPESVEQLSGDGSAAPQARPVVAASDATQVADRGPAPDRVATATSDAGRELIVHAKGPDGAPLAEIEVLCLFDDGRSLPTRLTSGIVHRGTTDAAGSATFSGLSRGKWELAVPGAVPKASVRIADEDVERDLRLPAMQTHTGTVTDPNGRPIAGASVVVGETGGRGERVRQIAVTDATGYFEGRCPLASGSIVARHPDYSQSISRRLLVGRPSYLKLEPLDDPVDVRVTDPDGKPVVGCLVGMLPQSQDMAILPPYHRWTDEHGCCTLPGPGRRHAAIVAQHDAWASRHVPYERTGERVELRLGRGATVKGVLLDADGEPLVGRGVALLVTVQKTNEPAGSMMQLRCRTDEAGRFRFEHAPLGLLQVRYSSDRNDVVGPPMFQFVVAGATVDARDGGEHEVRLVARKMRNITGTLRTPLGLPVVGYHILAVPDIGTAAHRMFRRRAARTDTDGRFVLPDVSSEESYRLGVFPPSRWWPNPTTWPIAMLAVDCEQPVEAVVDTSRRLVASLTCQVLRPDGKPTRGASLELRHLDYHSPFVTTTDASGNGGFQGLQAGEYWLAIKAAGLGSRTMKVTLDADDHRLDLGTVELEDPARIFVRISGQAAVEDPVVHVIGKNDLGDKFVHAVTQGGMARLRPLPPGRSRISLHGPGIEPIVIEKQFSSGRQWLDVAVKPASPVLLRFPFDVAANPFLINGPLHVRVLDEHGRLVLEHHVGKAEELGCFLLRTGLRPGHYRVLARSIWNQLAHADLEVPTGRGKVEAEIPLEFERGN